MQPFINKTKKKQTDDTQKRRSSEKGNGTVWQTLNRKKTVGEKVGQGKKQQ